MDEILHALRDRIHARSITAKMTKLDLPDFETPKECGVNQQHMLARFNRYPPTFPDWNALSGCTFSKCELDPCPEACWFGTYHRRVDAIATGLPILDAHSGPKWAVTIVHPLWEKSIGQLKKLSIRAAAQWNYRRLHALDIPNLLAIGGFEVSVNKELDGTMHWAGEIQQIVCGATKEQLQSAFEIEERYRLHRPGQRILDIRKFDSLPRKFAYGQKRFVTMRKAYKSAKTGRQGRFGNPPYAKDWAELDAWMLGLNLGARIILYGCSRRGTNFFKE